MRHVIDFTYHIIQIVIYKNRHDRSEDFFLHYSIGECHIIHDSRLNAECFAV